MAKEKIRLMQIGTIWVIIGSLVIAGGLLIGSLMVHYGNKLNQRVSEQKILAQQKESETAIRSDIKTLMTEISKLQESKEKELKSQFPAGYQLFGIIDKQIIPSPKPSSQQVKISWSTAKILNVTKDFVDIMLPDAILPSNITFTSNMVTVKNEEGFTSSGFIVINGWSPFVKILKSDGNKIIAAVGYAKIK
jgi:hypothetical protein